GACGPDPAIPRAGGLVAASRGAAGSRAGTQGARADPRLRPTWRMIVDASALLAIIFKEAGHESVLDRILAAPAVAAGAPTLAETGIVLQARLGGAADGMIERLLDELSIEEIPFGPVHWREAVDAYR